MSFVSATVDETSYKIIPMDPVGPIVVERESEGITRVNGMHPLGTGKKCNPLFNDNSDTFGLQITGNQEVQSGGIKTLFSSTVLLKYFFIISFTW